MSFCRVNYCRPPESWIVNTLFQILPTLFFTFLRLWCFMQTAQCCHSDVRFVRRYEVINLFRRHYESAVSKDYDILIIINLHNCYLYRLYTVPASNRHRLHATTILCIMAWVVLFWKFSARSTYLDAVAILVIYFTNLCWQVF